MLEQQETSSIASEKAKWYTLQDHLAICYKV